VSHAGGIYAFTGVSGEGKSTLVAALARRGMQVFADDVLVLDPTERPLALPGPARMKLWAAALALTGHGSVDAVRPGIDKFYVADQDMFYRHPLPIRRLYSLQSLANRPVGITRLNGVERFTVMRSSYYRPHFYGAIAEQSGYFETASRLAAAIPLACFNRTRDPSAFAASVSLVEDDIRGTTG
jgi:hypothetical protein